MPEEKKARDKEGYEIEEVEMSGKEIENLIERLQNMSIGEHIHLQIDKNKELMINKIFRKK